MTTSPAPVLARPPQLGPPPAKLTDRLREILDQLEDIVVEEGFSSLTIGELATRLRCSRRTLYELAPNRDELILVVIDRRMRRLGRMVRDCIKEHDRPQERVKIVLTGAYRALRAMSLRFAEDVSRQPAVRRLLNDHHRYAVALVQEAIEDGVESGDFRPVNAYLVAQFIDAALERAISPEVIRESGLQHAEDVALELDELIEHGLVSHRARTRRG